MVRRCNRSVARRVLDRAASRDAFERAIDRRHALPESLSEYGSRHARLDDGGGLRPRARRSGLGAQARNRLRLHPRVSAVATEASMDDKTRTSGQSTATDQAIVDSGEFRDGHLIERRGEFELSTDTARIDRSLIYRFLSEQSY